MARILVVDDVAALAEQYAYDLKRIGDYSTRIATSGKDALNIINAEMIDCIILDLEMPGIDGFEVLRRVRKQRIEIPVIVYTGTGDYDRCVKAIKLGAYSFIDKAESMERVALEVENAVETVRLKAEIEMLKKDIGADTSLIGTSRAMRQLKEQIERVAGIPSTVLIEGESGTGKELVARELHRLGAGEKKPFLAINCGGLAEGLIQSKLFGHERGAYTGANRTYKGAFEVASGGTLFLDEIGELSLDMQANMLRVLEERTIVRLGSNINIAVDARVIAATNRNLDLEVEKGNFRQDLYYRLNVHIIRVPPLRDRQSDIPELVEHFLKGTCERFGMREKRIDSEAMMILMKYDWRRNNVRELRNIIERMIIAAGPDMIGVTHIPLELREGTPAAKTARTFQELKAEAERQIVVSALDRNDWHITRTAQDLGLADHASLLKIMRRHNLKRR